MKIERDPPTPTSWGVDPNWNEPLMDDHEIDFEWK